MGLDQTFQEALIIDIITNTGISPWGTALSCYIYRSTATETRHLCLIDNQLSLYGGRQKGQSRREEYRELVVRSLCQQSRQCVVPYLTLFRAVPVSILRNNKWHVNTISMYETHLLAGPHFKMGGLGGVEVSTITASQHVVSEQNLVRNSALSTKGK